MQADQELSPTIKQPGAKKTHKDDLNSFTFFQPHIVEAAFNVRSDEEKKGELNTLLQGIKSDLFGYNPQYSVAAAENVDNLSEEEKTDVAIIKGGSLM